MFERFTLREVASSKRATIAFTLLIPRGWQRRQEATWLAFYPERRDAGFAVLMTPAEGDDGESVLETPEGLEAYLRSSFEQIEALAGEADDWEMCAYDLVSVRCRVEGVGGRLGMLGTAVRIEDVNFALVGFATDESFAALRPLFRDMIGSFQPMVQPGRR